jgi:hypothetical protein
MVAILCDTALDVSSRVSGLLVGRGWAIGFIEILKLVTASNFGLSPVYTLCNALHHTILESFQSKALSMTVDVPNTLIRRDLQTPTVKEEIRRHSSQYRARLSARSSEPHVAARQTPAK